MNNFGVNEDALLEMKKIDADELVRICNELGLTVCSGANSHESTYKIIKISYRSNSEIWDTDVIDPSTLLYAYFSNVKFQPDSIDWFLKLEFNEINKKYSLQPTPEMSKFMTVGMVKSILFDMVEKIKQAEIDYKLKNMENDFK
ncbi:MAG: hypothetical protein J6T10_06385 [Methanobrevibacter sp.]|nr:hypothetical protein [Methanobrevibacter sp.]